MSMIVRSTVGALILLISGVAALIPSPARAQSNCLLSLSVIQVPVQQLSLSDIDFEHFESHTLLFTISIANQDANALNAALEIKLSINLADGSLNEPNAMYLLTKTFSVPRGVGKTFTNMDLGQSGEIKDSIFNLADDVKNNVQDVALATGKLPAGHYVFLPTLKCPNGATIASGPVVYDIQNASRVELRSPRDGETTNEFPLFEFFSDADHVTLVVAEKLPDQSRDDAIARRPAMLVQDLMGQNSFLYSGGRPLEEGKTYVWQVVGKTRGSGGTDVDVPSPISLFTVSNVPPSEGGLPGASSTDDAILNQLEQMLGSRYAAIFQQIHNDGCKLTGRYDLDGKTLSQGEVLDLLNELRTIADSIDLTIE